MAANDTPTQVKTTTPEPIETPAAEEEEEELEEVKSEIKFDIAELYRPVSPSEVFCCSHCGEYVQSAKLMTHLVDTHPNNCHSFTCSECEFLVNAPVRLLLFGNYNSLPKK